jgi:two-component system, cell cycle sensor histidine kinase and response regulator CckA
MPELTGGLLAMLLAALAAGVVAVTRLRAAQAALGASEKTCRQLEETCRQFERPARGGTTARAPDQDVDQTQQLEAVGRLAGDIAHDLNDLLTAITGHTELLITNLQPDDPGVLDAHEIGRSALSAARLTKQLLALSRNQPQHAEVVDINEVVARTAGTLGPMLGEGISVILALDAQVKRIRVSASRVEEIVLNLALTARDTMPDGGRLTFTTSMHSGTGKRAPIEPAGEYVRLIVADTGCGIAEEIQSNVFEPFFTTQGTDGSAIGLAKVYGIVKQSGGHIHLDSVAGTGSTFTVDLPSVSNPLAPDSSNPVPRIIEGFATVLIVDDDSRVRDLAKLVLVRAGHDVQAVAGPHDALAVLHRQPDINLLLIDVVMPEMNGFDLAAEARKIVPNARIIFMSGFACDMTRQRAGDGFLAKPFTIESLTDAVEQTAGVV